MLANFLIGYNSTIITDTKEVAKNTLVSSLLGQLLPRQKEIKEVVSLYYDKNGCPQLHCHIPLQLNISFSYCDSELWGALALNYPVGIDVESTNSFSGNYPFDLIFSEDEQKSFAQLDEDPAVAAAGMWSCKEAAVKSRQSGFSDLGPQDVLIRAIEKTGTYFKIEVFAEQPYDVIAEKKGRIWRALAGPKKLN